MLRRRWVWVVVTTLLGLAAAGGYSATSTPTYQATASLFFSLQAGGSPNALAQGATYTQNQIASYAALIDTPSVLRPVIERNKLETRIAGLADRLTAQPVPDTVIIKISAADPSADRAADLANDVAAQLAATVEDLAPPNEEGKPSVRGTIVSPARPPSAAATPRTKLNLAVGLLAGLVVGVVTGLVRDTLDTRVRNAGDLRALTDLPLLGTFGERGRRYGRELFLETSPTSAEAQTFRDIRADLQFLAVPGRSLSMVVTSAKPGEGKTTVAANLAVFLADAGMRVALVDADLRRPAIANIFGVESTEGLTSLLIERARLDDVLRPYGPAGLQVLPSGRVPPNPAELIASPAMSRLVAELESRFEVVIVDAPPLLPVTDARILARACSGTLLTASTATLRRQELWDALRLLEEAEARVVGMVLTQVRPPAREDDTVGMRHQKRVPTILARASLPAAGATEPESNRGARGGSAVSRQLPGA